MVDILDSNVDWEYVHEEPIYEVAEGPEEEHEKPVEQEAARAEDDDTFRELVKHVKGHDDEIRRLLRAVRMKDNVLLLGPHGEGKTEIMLQLQRIMGGVYLHCSEEVTERELVAGFNPSAFVGKDPVHNGVDLGHFKPGPYPDGIVIGWVGRLSPEKNPGFVEKLRERLPDVEFLMATEDISYENMPAFYNRCSVIILPSLMEGFSNVLLEAYACGRPVICSEEALPEGFPGTSLPLDVEKWARAILDSSPGFLRTIAKRYTWDKHGAEMYVHFHETITGDAAQRSEADPSGSSP